MNKCCIGRRDIDITGIFHQIEGENLCRGPGVVINYMAGRSYTPKGYFLKVGYQISCL